MPAACPPLACSPNLFACAIALSRPSLPHSLARREACRAHSLVQTGPRDLPTLANSFLGSRTYVRWTQSSLNRSHDEVALTQTGGLRARSRERTKLRQHRNRRG